MSNYDPTPRGKCSLCKDYVWSDQQRTKHNGIYQHHRCPRRMGGLLKEINMCDRILARRASYYERLTQYKNSVYEQHLLYGFKLYLSLSEPRLSINTYSMLKSKDFRWNMNKLTMEVDKKKARKSTDLSER